ncbi:hypothetical protein [Acetobacter fabarum]|uniref:hypothetical protein n=1 Tax=Acetobacter fabarum TaxID=483199 RepID=UPI0039EB31AB
MDGIKEWLLAFSVPCGILGTIFGIITVYYGASVKFPLGWGLLILAVPVCAAYTFFSILCDERKKERIILPRVIRTIVDQYGLKDLTLLVEKSSILGQGVGVSVYTIRDGFELLLGEGVVRVVQRDGLTQVVITSEASGKEDIWREIYANRPDALKKTIIRPGLQMDI